MSRVNSPDVAHPEDPDYVDGPLPVFTNQHSQPLSFYVSRIIPGRSRWEAKIRANGGTVVDDAEAPGVIKLSQPEQARTLDDGWLSTKWVDDSIEAGGLMPKDEYECRSTLQATQGPVLTPENFYGVAGPQPRKQLGTGSRGGRVDFTPEEDALLRRVVHRPGVATSGNKIYKLIAERYGKHSFHSWRDRYVRHLRPVWGDPNLPNAAELEPSDLEIIKEASARAGKTVTQADGTSKTTRHSVPKRRAPPASSQQMQASQEFTQPLMQVAQHNQQSELDPALTHMSNTPEPVNVGQSAPRARTSFTSTDDEALLKAVINHGDHARTYQALAQAHPQHTWQSWKERVKTLRRRNGGRLPPPPVLVVADFTTEEHDEQAEAMADAMSAGVGAHDNDDNLIDPALQHDPLSETGLELVEGYMPSITHEDNAALGHDHHQTEDFDHLVHDLDDEGEPLPYQMAQASDLQPVQRVFNINDPNADEVIGPASQIDDSDREEDAPAAKRAKTTTTKKSKAPATPIKQTLREAAQPAEGRPVNRAKVLLKTPSQGEDASVGPVTTGKQAHHQKTTEIKKQTRAQTAFQPTLSQPPLRRSARSVSVMSEDDVTAATQLQSGRSDSVVAETAQKVRATPTQGRRAGSEQPQTTGGRLTRARMVNGTPEPTPARPARSMRRPTAESPILMSSRKGQPAVMIQEALVEEDEEEVEQDAHDHILFSQQDQVGDSQSLFIDLGPVDEDMEEGDESGRDILLQEREQWAQQKVADSGEVQLAVAYECWMACSGDQVLADQCLNSLLKKKGVPVRKDVWTVKDDAAAQGSDAAALTKVEKKHGANAVMDRLNFLELVRN